MEIRAKAFMIFLDNKTFIDRLNYIQTGKLFKSLFNYAEDNSLPKEQELDSVTEMVFEIFKLNLDKSMEKYKEVCKKRAEAGRKGGLAKASNGKQTVANLPNNNSNKNNNNKITFVKELKQ